MDAAQPGERPKTEIHYYVTSLAWEEQDEDGLMEIIRGHWSAIENWTHYRRDVTLG
ncbi:MAG: hypothetical protein ACREOE_08270 [Gemmatimonadales bacterium]